MKNRSFVCFVIAFVFLLFICTPLPVLACGGGGGGGESGPAGLVGPQSSSAGRPAAATFSRPTGSSFGQPGTAAYVGGINMGTPATVSAASRGAITANIPDTRQRSSIQEIVINRPLVQSGGSAISAIIPDVKAEEDYSEIQRIVSQERPETQRQRLEREMRDNEELRDMLASYGDAFDSYGISAEYAATLGTLAQAGIAIATAGSSSWLTFAGKVLLSGARGAADGYAYAAEKGKGGEASQAALSGGAAATIEIVTSPLNPLIGVGGSVAVDEIMHKDAAGRIRNINEQRLRALEEKQAENRSGLSFDVSITDQYGTTRHYGGGTR